MSDTYRTQDGDMVDEICWLYYGRTAGTVERVLAANKGLADAGPILPAGLLITLPTIADQEAQPAPVAKPWD
ncbi:tail protein X [Salinisphaera orenii]|uniref:Phage tail protein n=1 Tax=Salinisphaera orenii YIM 95161 TaxID=1051139 RepID=A0A423PQI4_9GAMM|nr:tail protein X [Salinisphaera halophila]ROO27874.1 phage tail protein [Salinisphaera halophila YIM 95161]